MENIETKPVVQSALAKINDFDLEDFDILEQKFGMNGGNSAIVYFLIAVANIASFPVFAAYSLVAVPGTITLGLTAMLFRSLGRCKSEDLVAEKNFNDQNGGYVDVPSEEVPDEPVPQLNASAVQEILPGSSAPVGSRVAPTSPATKIQSDTTIQPGSPFVGNPFQSPVAGSDRLAGPTETPPALSTEQAEALEYEKWADAEAAKSMEPIEMILLMPLKNRAEYILDKLAAYGCDLWQYMYAPILGINGEQQSGKTTLCLIVAILESAFFGKRINYVTVDGDVYPIKFASACSGHQFYKKAAEYISGLTKDSAAGDIWVFDETSNASEVVPDAIGLLWLKFLTGFKKTGATARLPLHGTTASAMGIPTGRNESAKREMTFIQAHLKREFIDSKEIRNYAKGGEYPSGNYSLLEFKGDKLEPIAQLTLPDWLQIANAPNGHPCYVRSLLRYFPELDSRVLNYTPPNMFEEPDTEKTDEPASDRPDINGGNEFVDYWSKQPAPSRPVSQEADPFAVDSYQATETVKPKKKVKMTDVIPGTLAGTPKTYEQVIVQVSGWLRKEPDKWFTTSDLLSKFKGKKKISKDGEPDVFYTERNVIRKVISSIVIAMGKSPREAYEVIRDPEKGLTIRFPAEEEEDDEEMISIEFFN